MIHAMTTVLVIVFGLFVALVGVLALLRLASGSDRSAISAPTGGALTGAFADTLRVLRRASWLLLTMLWATAMYFFAVMILPNARECWMPVATLSALLFGAWALKR